MTFTYAPAPESPALAQIAPSYGLFIDGSFVDPADGGSLTTINPATEEVLCTVAAAGPTDVHRAVAAARRAQHQVWGPMPGAQRAAYLFRLARILAERSRELAVLETLDNGKPIRESRNTDLPLVSSWFFHYAGWADKLDHVGLGRAPRPYGVVAAVLPWNFPLMMLAWKVAPALAAGNTVVLKPAETTPLTALRFAEICQQADLPPGVVNILPGGPDTGAALVAHPDIDKIAFTGSTAVGRRIAEQVADRPVPLTLELGGKGANIVYDDAPLDEAIEGIVNGIFFNQGHVGSAGSRLLVAESVSDEVLDALTRRVSLLRLGDPLDNNTDIGAINSAAQLARIHALADTGDAQDAQRWTAPCELPEHGFWFPPTVFTGVTQAHRIAREEIFGPVLSVLTFRTPQEAVDTANNTPYGLSAGVWTQKGSRLQWTAQRLRAGVVWANTFNRLDPSSPFGGYKESGYGRHGGRHGMAAYLAPAPAPTTGDTATGPTTGGTATGDEPPVAHAAGSSRPSGRLAVHKTYKLFLGGAFVGSESGRTYPVADRAGTFLTTAAAASRKDARDAVVAARTALRTWSSASADHRGQVLSRVAELLEGRRDELVGLVRAADGVDDPTAQRLVSASVDRWVWYAGWADKLAQLTGAVNPVAGPYVSFSVPEPTGVVAVVAPQRDSLLGLVSVLAPVLATGCTAVVLASEHRPGPAISLAEVLATADVPPGAVNILTGAPEEAAGWLAGHADVNAVDVTGAESGLAKACEHAAARTLKRVHRPDAEADWTATPSLERLLWLLEIKTVWQTVGL